MTKRRLLAVLGFGLALALGALGGGAWAAAGDGPRMDERGLFVEPWFHQSTLDLSKDLAAAAGEGKILAVVWEQKGCTYCRRMHEIVFRDAEIVDYIKERFYFVQLDMRGDRQITDFDGTAMPESWLAVRHRVNGTPNIEFRDRDGNELFRMPGYAEPLFFRGVFEYVATGGYETASVQDWLGAWAAQREKTQ